MIGDHADLFNQALDIATALDKQASAEHNWYTVLVMRLASNNEWKMLNEFVADFN